MVKRQGYGVQKNAGLIDTILEVKMYVEWQCEPTLCVCSLEGMQSIGGFSHVVANCGKTKWFAVMHQLRGLIYIGLL